MIVRIDISKLSDPDYLAAVKSFSERQLAATHRALLRTMHDDLIIAEAYRRGWNPCFNSTCARDRPPPGYPPRAEDDYTPEALPFDRDRR